VFKKKYPKEGKDYHCCVEDYNRRL